MKIVVVSPELRVCLMGAAALPIALENPAVMTGVEAYVVFALRVIFVMRANAAQLNVKARSVETTVVAVIVETALDFIFVMMAFGCPHGIPTEP